MWSMMLALASPDGKQGTIDSFSSLKLSWGVQKPRKGEDKFLTFEKLSIHIKI